MPSYTTADIHNIAFLGQNGSGKTTLIESILFHMQLIPRMGSVDDGTTVCDYEPEEKHHKHSLKSAIVSFDWRGKHFNFIDTPGYPDFIGKALSVMEGVETAAIVIAADKGIQAYTRRLFKEAEERSLPRFIIVNKIDEHIKELPKLLAGIRETFGSECLPLNLPSKDGTQIIDAWEKDTGDTAFSSVAEAHQALVDQCVETDEALMSVYLEQGKLTHEQLHDAFERALREGHLVPVLFCSARTGEGVLELMEVLEKLCPNPLEGNPRKFLLTDPATGQTSEFTPKPDLRADPVGHVFKITSDQFVGKIGMVRVHQGTIGHASQVCLDENKKPLKLGHLYKCFGKETKEVDGAIPGDIVVLAKLEELHYGGVLHAPSLHGTLRCKAPAMPRSMFGLAITARSRNDEAKIGPALHKLAEEDPTFVIEHVEATHETVIRGIGELHLRVILETLKNRFHIELDTKPPRVAYKETIRAKADGHHRHKKQTGGAGQFGEVYLRVEPLPADHPEGFEFVSEVVGGTVPRQFWPAVEKGVRQVLSGGAIAGYPMTGVRVALYDGKYHDVDSKEVAFITAGKRAFIDAVSKARPALLEPFVNVEITVPASHMGDIAADLSGKRGQVQDTDYLPGDICVMRAKVPLSEMNNYSSQLKSMTAGQGSFSMEYSHDEVAPANVQAEIVAAYKPRHEED